jgi:3-dehydroquinate synthase II
MKEVWLLADAEVWDDAKERIKDAIEIGYDGVFVRNMFAEKARKLGRIEVISLEDAMVRIKSAEDQQKAIEKSGICLLEFSDWKVIPLENVVAMKKNGKIIAAVENIEEAKLALTTLEKGADGIAVRGDRDLLRKYYEIVKEGVEQIELRRAKINEIRPLGVGERVCIDTVTLMNVGEGMLVGNKASFMFLVASESEESEYVSSRPFRVNAGSVNAYIKVGEKTRYLSELKAGDEVEIVSSNGTARRSFVGRVKIERRPLLLIKASTDGDEGTVILQNAETIKLVSPDGRHVSVSELKEGDEVLVWTGKKARHFGVEVDEFIVEK